MFELLEPVFFMPQRPLSAEHAYIRLTRGLVLLLGRPCRVKVRFDGFIIYAKKPQTSLNITCFELKIDWVMCHSLHQATTAKDALVVY